MKFTISRDKLFEALQNVIGVVPVKTSMPILQNVKIYSEDGLIKIMATDIEIMLVSWASAEIGVEGSTTIPAKTLYDIIRELPSTNLEIEIDEFDRTYIKSPFGEYKLSGQDSAEFPKLPLIDAQSELTFDNIVLRKIIDKTLYTCGKDDLRPALNGVLINATDGQLTAVSTDMHRMSKLVISPDNINDIEMRALIPTRAMNYLIKLLESDGKSTLYLSEKHVLFNVKDTLIFSRLIYKEQFPNYDRILPTEFTHTLKVNKEELIASTKRVKIFASQLSHLVYFNLNRTSIDITAEDVDFGGEGHEKISAEFDGDDFFLSFNANYLLEVLQHIKTEYIKIFINSINNPVVIRGEEQEEKEDYLVLVMPVKISTNEE